MTCISLNQCPLGSQYKHISVLTRPRLPQDEKQRTTSVTSRMLEDLFLSDRTSEVKVVKGQRHYVISFKGTTSCHLLTEGELSQCFTSHM